MLDNLSGPDVVSSKELVSDLKQLCGLAPEDLSDICKVVSQMGKGVISEEDEFLKKMEKNVKVLRKDRELLQTIPQITRFVFLRWAKRNLRNEQIVADLDSIGISREQKANLEPLLRAMEENIKAAREELLGNYVMQVGIPMIKSAVCSCDMRAVFQDYLYEKEKDDEQAYFALDHFVPVAVLEIVSQLNEAKTNHAFLMDETELEDLCGILQRARKRIARMKMALRGTSYLKD